MQEFHCLWCDCWSKGIFVSETVYFKKQERVLTLRCYYCDKKSAFTFKLNFQQ